MRDRRALRVGGCVGGGGGNYDAFQSITRSDAQAAAVAAFRPCPAARRPPVFDCDCCPYLTPAIDCSPDFSSHLLNLGHNPSVTTTTTTTAPYILITTTNSDGDSDGDGDGHNNDNDNANELVAGSGSTGCKPFAMSFSMAAPPPCVYSPSFRSHLLNCFFPFPQTHALAASPNRRISSSPF